jgi:8-oxo-dGTP pyrophosphatase MutT (NUDIX family)
MDRVHSVARSDGLHVIPAPLPAVTVVIVRPRPLEVLLIRRPQHMRFAAGVWVFPGGRVDEGETLVEAAVRETHEETALKIDASACAPLDWWVTPETETRRFDVHFLIAPAPDDQVPVANADEVDELRWITPAEAIAEGLPLLRPTRSVLERLAHVQAYDEAVPEVSLLVPRMPRPFLVDEAITWHIVNADTDEILERDVLMPRWEAHP